MKITSGTWIMALDGRKMVLLRNEGDTQKPILRTILQDEAENPRSSEQGTDKPGRTFSSASPRRSSLNETDWHDEAKKDFARSAMRLLEQEHQREGGDVILFAAPAVLGNLRKHCPDKVRSAIIAEIDKDVVNHAPEQIAAIIAAVE